MDRLRILQIIDYHSKDVVFEWGKTDCCLWVADILKSIHGIDYAKIYRDKYSSKTGCRRLLMQLHYENIKQLLLNILGVEGILEPRIGDPILLKEKGEYLLGICCGTYNLFLTEKGTTSRKLHDFDTYWEL